MRIYFKVEQGYDDQIQDQNFSLDINPRDSISNLMVHITLRYSRLKLRDFVLKFKGKYLNPKKEDSLIKFHLQENDCIELQHPKNGKCVLI